MGKEYWYLGFDPGFGQAGAVLRKAGSKAPKAWATWTAGTGDEFMRALAMAESMVTRAADWVDEYNIDNLAIAIEMHVYKRNAVTYRKQSRLLEELESGLLAIVTPSVDSLLVGEPMPGTSKRLATGSGKADKEQMIAACEPHFAVGDLEDAMSMGDKNTLHTLADSWAHSLAAEDMLDPETKNTTHVRDFTNIKAHQIRGLAEGSNAGS